MIGQQIVGIAADTHLSVRRSMFVSLVLFALLDDYPARGPMEVP